MLYELLMQNNEVKTITLDWPILSETVMLSRTQSFLETMSMRRTIRSYSSKTFSIDIIKNCIKIAGSSPSGANRQPWHFAVVANPLLKQKIRTSAESEEKEFYTRRAPQDWLNALAPLGTDANKPFLETAPYLIVVFGLKYSQDENGKKLKNYYVTESVGIATGLLLASLHQAGLATLTHTPSPMQFLNQILGRPDSEKPLMILVTGYPAETLRVPDISRKSLDEIASFHL